jgi:hypothetical protein
MNRIGALCFALLIAVPVFSLVLPAFSLRTALLQMMINVGAGGLVVVSAYRWWAVRNNRL